MTIDVRRTVKLEVPVTGARIVDALQTLAIGFDRDYAERVLNVIDGVKTLDVGISGSYPSDDVGIKTGENFDQGIRLEESYARFMVVTTRWPGKKYLVDDGDDIYKIKLNKVADGLEELLKS